MFKLSFIYLFTCIIICLLVCLVVLYTNNNTYLHNTNLTNLANLANLEAFKANSNITDQSLMDFSYLTDKKYVQNIMDKYYLNDDTKIDGVRLVNHPYMYLTNNKYGLKWYNPVKSNIIYDATKVRL